MKISTKDGLIEAKVIKHLTINNRKVSVHHWLNWYNEFDSCFTVSDYSTGMQIPRSKSDSVKGAISNAKYTLSSEEAKNYDYSKHEVMNH